MDMNFEDYDGGDFIVDYAKVAHSSETHPVCRLLALDLMKNSYITPGEWLQKISDYQLNELTELSERLDDDALGALLLLTLMLSSAEGIPIDSDEFLSDSIAILRSLIAVTSLQRKGLIIAHYNNMSFGRETIDKIIAERIPGVDYGSLGMPEGD